MKQAIHFLRYSILFKAMSHHFKNVKKLSFYFSGSETLSNGELKKLKMTFIQIFVIRSSTVNSFQGIADCHFSLSPIQLLHTVSRNNIEMAMLPCLFMTE